MKAIAGMMLHQFTPSVIKYRVHQIDALEKQKRRKSTAIRVPSCADHSSDDETAEDGISGSRDRSEMKTVCQATHAENFDSIQGESFQGRKRFMSAQVNMPERKFPLITPLKDPETISDTSD